MNTHLDQAIIGSWELISTTEKDIDVRGYFAHFSSDGRHTVEVPDVHEFIQPCRYKLEEDKLIFVWTGWGKENSVCTLSLEGAVNLKVVNHHGIISIYRRLDSPKPQMHAFINSSGKLERREKPNQTVEPSGVPPLAHG